MMQRVLIIQALMKQFRVPFFSQLHAALGREGIDLRVAYSAPNPTHALRRDNVDLPAEIGYKVPARWVGQRLLYQPLRHEILQADLVITGPENKYLNNLWLLPYSTFGLKTVAFWGLAPNMHPDRRSAISEWIKARQVTSVDWWFAYTESVAISLRQHGMPADRITIVQNATDTTELRRLLAEITEDETAEAKKQLTGNAQSNVGIYCGRLEYAKALPFLLESARLVKQRCPEFHLVIVGNGPDRAWLQQSIANEPWIHYMGSKWGRESALLYKMSDLFLLPGSAGLAVVDSFAAGLPLIATELPSHPPEISYLRDGEEGRITAHHPHDFSNAVIEIFSARELMLKLRRGAENAGSWYTMEAMVENFRSGVKKCLANRSGVVAKHSISVTQKAERDSVV